MAVDERTRYELFLRLEQVLGPDEAATLMEHLPPVGWGEVATKRDLDQFAVTTKRDLDHLQTSTKHEFEYVRLEMREMEARLTANFRGELIAQTRVMVFTLTSSLVTVAGLAFAAARLV